MALVAYKTSLILIKTTYFTNNQKRQLSALEQVLAVLPSNLWVLLPQQPIRHSTLIWCV